MAGHVLSKLIEGRGTVLPPMPDRAVDALIRDLQRVETLHEWEIERATKGTHRTNGARVGPTPRQLQFAQGIANGKSHIEIARELGVRPASVWSMMERLRFNIDAKSNEEAVAMLSAAGLVTVRPLPQFASRRGSGRPRSLRLTRPELDVLTLVADGKATHEIAAELRKGHETVKSQAKSLRVRLGARNLAHAVALGFRTGALRP